MTSGCVQEGEVAINPQLKIKVKTTVSYMKHTLKNNNRNSKHTHTAPQDVN